MKRYEYRNLHLEFEEFGAGFRMEFGDTNFLIDENELLNTLNQWGDLNWELIDFDIGWSNFFAANRYNLFFLFKRELNDDLTPNKNNKCEYRVVIENTSDPFTKKEQDKYFLDQIKEGFDLVKNINIKFNNKSGIMYFPYIIYVFKKKI